jgi:hypothetical protein
MVDGSGAEIYKVSLKAGILAPTAAKLLPLVRFYADCATEK